MHLPGTIFSCQFIIVSFTALLDLLKINYNASVYRNEESCQLAAIMRLIKEFVIDFLDSSGAFWHRGSGFGYRDGTYCW